MTLLGTFSSRLNHSSTRPRLHAAATALAEHQVCLLAQTHRITSLCSGAPKCYEPRAQHSSTHNLPVSIFALPRICQGPVLKVTQSLSPHGPPSQVVCPSLSLLSISNLVWSVTRPRTPALGAPDAYQALCVATVTLLPPSASSLPFLHLCFGGQSDARIPRLPVHLLRQRRRPPLRNLLSIPGGGGPRHTPLGQNPKLHHNTQDLRLLFEFGPACRGLRAQARSLPRRGPP